MAEETIINNKRIIKNTAFLYVRMFFIMAVTLYTSRVVLQVLGVEDFGIFNVVGGIVAMMGILNGAMTSSVQRFLSFEIGTGDNMQLKRTFGISLIIYVILCFAFVASAETIGLWFLNSQLNIPLDRMNAANWVYQFTIVSVIVKLLGNPYNAAIIAHEDMNVFAYVSILEVLLNLIIVYLLLVITFDKLIVYGILYTASAILITSCYYIICVKRYSECGFVFIKDKKLFNRILSYSGWNLFGSVAGVVKGQGLNVLLSMFFSPSVNAARGIAFQINTAVTQFFTNFYTAVRPQITMYYAQGDIKNMLRLVFQSSKFSYYLILLISLPIMIETPTIIKIWLGQLPDYVVIFTRLIIVISAIDAMANPLMTTAHATGRIALYQSVIGTVIIMNIPISYVLLKLGYSPVSVFVVSLCISFICLFIRLWIVKRLVEFPIRKYLSGVFCPVLIVTVVSCSIPILLKTCINYSLDGIIIICIICVLSTTLSVVFVGMTHNERTLILKYINTKIKSKSVI